MGNYIVKRGILLDERDLDVPQEATLDCIENAVIKYLEERFGNSDPETWDNPPWLETDGMVAERFGMARVYSDKWMNWVRRERGFTDALLGERTRLEDMDINLVDFLDLLEVERKVLEPRFREKICKAVMENDLVQAEQLISILEDLRLGHIPGVQPKFRFDRDGEEGIFDFRDEHYAAGTRILAEIGFNWGQ